MNFSDLQEELARKGYKMTKRRQAILEYLLEESGWVTVGMLHEKLLQDYPGMDFSTVYRNLDTLAAMGILCRVDQNDNGVFAYCLRETNQHHHHLVCRSCGKISPLHFCPLEQLSKSQTDGYSDLQCRFEVYGYCNDCQLSKANNK
jgi:Fe2+ or Zn2+ uptake regulation protein